MSTTLADPVREGAIQTIGRITLSCVSAVGDVILFFWEMTIWMLTRFPRRAVLLPNMFQIGVQSVPVVLVTGAFIGMVIAVQSYDQFRFMHMETNLGAVINISLVKELGPVLAATMLAGRVGSAMAAELGTMRITEQIDALRALGANPVHYLVVPRFMACVLLVPMLTIVADAAGVLGGWAFATQVCGIDSLHYWKHSAYYVGTYELFSGAAKSVFFGGTIAIISCHRGFRCHPGAEGVGRAATEAFVFSFMAILISDFFMGIIINGIWRVLWGT